MVKVFNGISKTIWLIIFLGFLVRVLLSFSTFHPDIRAFQLGGQLVASGNILNLYDFLGTCTADDPRLKTFGTDLFIYPPLIYIYHGVFNFIFSYLFGSIENSFLIEKAGDFGNSLFNIHLLLLKIPYLFFDFLAAYFFVRLFNGKKERIAALVFWLFNPVNLYATFIMGQFDLIPVFFTVLALYFIKLKKIYPAALALGFGAAFKVYPLLFVFPLVFQAKDYKKRFLILTVAVLPYLVSILPFLNSAGFRSSALVAGLTQKAFFAKLPISGGESLILLPMFLIALYIYYKYNPIAIENIWQRFFVILLMFFIFTHYHPQWFLWLTPFLMIDFIKSNFKNRTPFALTLVSFAGLLFFFDASLTVGIFAPIFPQLYILGTIWEVLGLNIDINYFRSVLQTLFAGAAIYYIYKYLFKNSAPRELH